MKHEPTDENNGGVNSDDANAGQASVKIGRARKNGQARGGQAEYYRRRRIQRPQGYYRVFCARRRDGDWRPRFFGVRKFVARALARQSF